MSFWDRQGKTRAVGGKGPVNFTFLGLPVPELASALDIAKSSRGWVPAGRGDSMTPAELVDEYLKMHQPEQVTIAKLRWLLGKATGVFGELRLAEILPEQVYAWRLTITEGHRIEATQALRRCSTVRWRGG
jgi:hypothetical protein